MQIISNHVHDVARTNGNSSLNILANGTRRDGSYNFGQISNICTRILNP
jgi:hypothetical protein